MQAEGAARYQGGELHYPDAASLRADFDAYVSHGVIRAVGEALPLALSEFEFRFTLPDGNILPLSGRVIAGGPEGALVEVIDWGPKHLSAVRAAIEADQPRPPASAARPVSGGHP